MAWEDPVIRETGDLITAAIWNQDVVDNIQWLKDTANAVAILEELQSSGSDGGAFNSGAWRTRSLNYEHYDPQEIVTLAGSQFTPVAGHYLVFMFGVAYYVHSHITRIYNATTGEAATGVGSAGWADTDIDINNLSIGFDRLVANGSDAFELQHLCQATKGSNGFGRASNIYSNLYAQVVLIKIDD